MFPECIPYRRDYTLSVRFCAVLKSCSPAANVYNPVQAAPFNAAFGYEPYTLRIHPGKVDTSRPKP
jgi:hypothetical protein